MKALTQVRWTASCWLAIVAGLAALLTLGLAAVACGGDGEGPTSPTVPADDPKALGPSDAPVVILEYSDFQ